MTLFVLPDDGIGRVTTAIARAKKSIHVTIFRCDLKQIESALAAAVERGVKVHALIAHTNRLGEKQLRKLELRLLGAGVTVSRTMDDLVRYHDKLLIVDERTLFVLAYNFTWLDTSKSRSMGLMTTQRRFVREAMKLFEADATRQPFTASQPDLVISPLNARARLMKFIGGARRELLIYDPRVIDYQMLRLLQQRVNLGVDVRILGHVSPRGGRALKCAKTDMRLHLRAILRDGHQLFIGSQSLRPLELDHRREVGIIVRDAKCVKRFRTTFEEDWTQATQKDKDDKKAEEVELAEAAVS